MNKLSHIGTIELVSLPDDQIEGVPAKIDTGADNSVIWASNIHIEDNKLVFNFFEPGSVYYRPEQVVSSAYKTTTVRNSFGHEEFRYMIKLKVQIGDHTLVRWFSLADRSRNNYPILLGKNFLKNRFVVDVSQKHLVSKSIPSNKVLVLGARKSAKFFEQVSKYNKRPIEYECLGYDTLVFYINGKATQVINVHDGRTDLAAYAFTYFKSHQSNAENAAAVSEYLRFKGRPYVDREVGNYTSGGKLTEYMQLACYGLPVPQTICAHPKRLKEMFEEINSKLGAPFVLKEIMSNRGKNNFLIENKQDFLQVLQQAKPEHVYAAQQYIKNDGFIRLYVFGKEVDLAVKRSSYPNTNKLKRHLNKPAGGANATKVGVSAQPRQVQDMAIKAASCMDRQLAGIDVIQDIDSKKWYILEVNNAPQLRSGSFVEDKAAAMARYLDKEINR